jgi:hypothetical protein
MRPVKAGINLTFIRLADLGGRYKVAGDVASEGSQASDGFGQPAAGQASASRCPEAPQSLFDKKGSEHQYSELGRFYDGFCPSFGNELFEYGSDMKLYCVK